VKSSKFLPSKILGYTVVDSLMIYLLVNASWRYSNIRFFCHLISQEYNLIIRDLQGIKFSRIWLAAEHIIRVL